jgi:predicted nucleic acid-binding protein
VFARYHLKHGIGILDTLIGQIAVDLDLPLHTFNQKHYSAIPSLKTIQPYRKGSQTEKQIEEA